MNTALSVLRQASSYVYTLCQYGSYITKVGINVVKVIQVTQSGVECYELIKKANQTGSLSNGETIKLVSEFAIILFGSLDLCPRGYNLIFHTKENTKLFQILKVLTSKKAQTGLCVAIEISKVISVKSIPYFDQGKKEKSIKDIAGIICVGVCEIAGNSHTKIAKAVEFGGSAVQVILNKDDIKSAGHVILKWTKMICGSVKGNGIFCLHINAENNTSKQIPGAAVIQNAYESLNQIQNQNLDDIEEIPLLCYVQMVFELNICQITKKPIRFVVGPKGYSNLNITYEKKAIKDFYSQSIPPSGWPENLLEFKEDNVEEYTGRQEMIDLALKKCIDYWGEAKKNNQI